VGFGELSNGRNVVHRLYYRVGVRIKNMSLQATKIGLVVEAADARDWADGRNEMVNLTHPKSKSSTPNFEYSISTRRYIRGMSASKWSVVALAGSD